MIGAPAAADAVARAKALPTLRVGLHAVLVDGDPIADHAEIPGLLDRGGRLRNDLLRYSAEIAANPLIRKQIEREITAQFEAYRLTGLPLDHVNAHRHFHLHPTVAAAIIHIGRQHGMKALRVPFEPWRIVADIDPGTRRLAARAVAPWAARLLRSVRKSDLTAADAVFGLAWSGAMTKARLAPLLGQLPAGLIEIYLHPGASDDFAGAAPGYHYAEEFAALCDPDCIAAARQSGYALGGYGDAAG